MCQIFEKKIRNECSNTHGIYRFKTDNDSFTRRVLNNMTIEFGPSKQQHDLSTKQAMERVRITTVTVQKQYVLHILSACSLSYPACNSNAPFYIIVWLVQLYTIFPHYFANGMTFGKSYLTKNVCFNFLYNFLSEKCLTLRRAERDSILVFM